MKPNNNILKVLKYVIEQADRYDAKNLQYEQDIKFNISKAVQILLSKLPQKVTEDITSPMKLEMLMIDIQRLFDSFTNAYINELKDKFIEYENKAYGITMDLIQVGNEIAGKLSEPIKEYKTDYDEETINFIRKHAFELMKSHNNKNIDKMRNQISNLMLTNKANKMNVRLVIEDVMSVNKSKAEEIAQTELSRAYNYGVLRRFSEYEKVSGEKMYKYWHGFKYSEVTCGYCRDRIGEIYDIDDNSESLPAHVRCRCVWLPVLESWNNISARPLIVRANMVSNAYSKDLIYSRINSRLGINYAEYMSPESASDYLSGDRSEKVMNALNNARNIAISNKISDFNISPDTSNSRMSSEFNTQMNFWKQYTAKSLIDNDSDSVYKSIEAIKGIMLLNWNTDQMQKWNQLISKIR